MSVRIIATGGTFDKRYDAIRGALGFGATHLHALVERARVAGPLQIEVAMMVDSLEMTDAQRAEIVDACRRAPEPRLVVVHGTDSMTLTARALGAAALDKTIVLTGAMVPYDVADSDAAFNLGFALGSARALPAGVWVAMNAAVHAWDRVRKNVERGVFEPLG